VTLGAGTVIGPHCVVGAGTEMGKNNRTFSGAQVGVLPQDLKHRKGSFGRTIIGDNNVIREFMTISSGTDYGDGEKDKATRIGNNCLFMTCSHVGHDCIVGDSVILSNSAALAGHVEVQSHAILGGMSGVHQFCVMGKYAFIAAMGGLRKDGLPYMIYASMPGICHGPNAVGLERHGFSKEAIKRIRAMYKLLFRSGLNTTQALSEIEKQVEDSEERRTITEFIRNSKRGIQ
jgi:UDP-N-acetylglucosamine acyltransferase